MMKKFKAISIGCTFLVVFSAGQVFSQMSLPAHSSVYTSLTRGYWFKAPCNFTITALRVAPDAGTGLQYIHVMKCTATFPVAFGTPSTAFTTLAYISGATNNTNVSVNISVTKGDQIGIMGTVTGICNSYSASAIITSTINGLNVNLNRFGYQGGIETGAAPNYWGLGDSTAGQIGRIFMYYTIGQPIRLTSATTIQPDTTGIAQGATNKMIVGIKLNTTGGAPSAKVTRFSFDTAGTFNYSNITGNAKVYYTGNSATFNTTNLFDSTVSTPTAPFTISGTRTLDTGIVYFWLTFNVSPSAVIGNYLDAKCTQIRWDSSGTTLYKTPVIISPTGRRRIIPPPKTLNSITYNQPLTTDVYRNFTNNPVLRITVNVTGTTGTLNLNQIIVKAKNTNNADVTNVKLYSTTTTTFSTSNQVGSSTNFSGGTATFPALNYSLPTGATYIWVTYDISATATINDSVDAEIPANGISIGALLYPASLQNPAGFRLIKTNYQYDAGITEIVSPVSPYCNTNPSIKVSLMNYGITTLTSDTIRWTINGVNQTPYPWTGSLATGNSTIVTLGSFTFTLGTPYTIKVYPSLFNGIYSDLLHANDTASKNNIILYPIPVAGFNINDIYQCFRGNSFIFTNTSTIASGTFTSYWNFGDTMFSTLTSPSHSYRYIDTLPVKLVVSSVAGCKDSISKNAGIKPSPIASFSISDTSKCLKGNLFLFTNTSTGQTTNNWSFGDTTFSINVNPAAKSYLYVGTKSVKLSTSNTYGCKDSLAKNVYVRPYPVSGFTINYASQCLRDNSFVYTNTSTGQASNFWSFGDTTFSSLASPAKKYLYIGTKSVKLVTTSAYGCKDSISNNVDVRPNPISGFTINLTPQCQDVNSFVFTNTSTGQISDNWSFGDTTFSTLASPAAKIYLYSGIKSVKLVTTNTYGCKDSMVNNVEVRPHPISGFTINKASQCLKGNSFVYTNTSTGQTSNYWNFGDTTYSTQALPAAKKYLYSGTKSVKLLTTNTYGCKDSIIKNVYARAHPVSGFTINNSIQCLRDNSFVFTNTTTGQTTNNWSFGDTTFSALASPAAKSYLYVGPKSVKLVTTSSFGCKDSITNNIDVRPHPISGFTIDKTSQCLSGNSFVFTNTSTGQTANIWNFGDTTSSVLVNPAAKNYLYSGLMSVKLIVINTYGCEDSIYKMVIVYPQPSASFMVNDTNQCEKDNEFEFTNTSTISSGTVNYFWDLGDGTQNSDTNNTHSYTSATSYLVRLKVISLMNCSDSVKQTIHIASNPVVDLGNDTIIKGNQSLVLMAGSGYDAYLWTGNATTDQITVDSATYGLGIETIWVKVTKNGCDGSDTIRVEIISSVSIDDPEANFELKMYPNPVNSLLNIELSPIRKEMVITLTDVNGKQLKKVRIQPDYLSSLHQIDVSELSKGIYYLNISNSETSKTTKIVKY
jgi:PKD repeat protein